MSFDVPRVLRVEHGMRASLQEKDIRRPGAIAEWTEADVLTQFGEVHVRVPGFQADRRCYPALIEVAMDQAWFNFCTADMFAMR